MTYRIVRMFFNGHQRRIIKEGLTEKQARAHCKDPETSSSTCTGKYETDLTAKLGPWFDGYEEE
jgi:hypothetical protein